MSDVCFMDAARELESRLCNNNNSDVPPPVLFSHTNLDSHSHLIITDPTCQNRRTKVISYNTLCIALLNPSDHHTTRTPRPPPLGISTMSASTQNQDCPLLDLPVETLQRITDLLDTNEALLVVRLTRARL